ncbi:MAG: tetratricopeptide repeat protein, partial [Actinomycetota bacterium]
MRGQPLGVFVISFDDVVDIQKLFAEVAILRGDVPEAIDRLQRASRMGPADPSVLRRLLSLLYASNRMQEAQQTLALLG